MALIEKEDGTLTTVHTKQQRVASAKAAVFDACQTHAFNPIEALVLYARGDYAALDIEPDKGKDADGHTIDVNPIGLKMRYAATKEVAQYYAPKLKSVEVRAADKGDEIPDVDMSLLSVDEVKALMALTRKAQGKSVPLELQQAIIDIE